MRCAGLGFAPALSTRIDMATQPTIGKQDDSSHTNYEMNRHTRQGLAGLRDTMGADEETWPYLVSAIVGAAGVAVASLVGAAELAVGVAAAYVAYDVIARGVPLWDAIKQAEDEVKE
jgi:hypothetical protein